MRAFASTLNPCPRLIDALIAAWATPASDATALDTAWADAWHATHAVYHLQARQAWVRTAERERDVPTADLAEAILAALQRDQRCRPGLAEVWDRHGTPAALFAWRTRARTIIDTVLSGG